LVDSNLSSAHNFEGSTTVFSDAKCATPWWHVAYMRQALTEPIGNGGDACFKGCSAADASFIPVYEPYNCKGDGADQCANCHSDDPREVNFPTNKCVSDGPSAQDFYDQLLGTVPSTIASCTPVSHPADLVARIPEHL
jgi:hypothetical protein